MVRRSAFVTGSSTGIGYATVRRLSLSGWRVWAGIRASDDAHKLAKLPGVTPVEFDVRNSSQITAAFKCLNQDGVSSGLDLLVTNAGVVFAGPLEFVTHDEWQEQFEVNVTGVALTIAAALPLLSATPNSRIVAIGSINSRVAVPLVSPYVASKHALVGLINALRRELPYSGPQITLLEPGAVETPLWEKVRQLPVARQPSEDISDTGRYDALVRSARRRLSSNNQLRMDPDRVARAVEKCADCKNPPRRKVLGRDARLAAFAKAILTEAALDRVFRRMHAN